MSQESGLSNHVTGIRIKANVTSHGVETANGNDHVVEPQPTVACDIDKPSGVGTMDGGDDTSDEDGETCQEGGSATASFSVKMVIEPHVPFWMLALLVGITYGIIFPTDILIINHLPSPKFRNLTMPGEFIEEGAREYLEGLVSNGARPAGSFENDVYAMKYIQDAVMEIQSSTKTNKTIEMDIQRPTGSFFMPFLDDFTSYYANITNTVIRVSSPESDQNALLLNCHTDTVVNSPGASDDGVACAILLEILRAVAAENTSLRSPLILLFNGAEENILQGSHGFITQHKWAEQVKAFINLEAAGAGGKEVLFQVGPGNPWLVWTWAKHAPYPSGSSMGQDLFQSGAIPADTDFRIFRDHGNVPGIDLAYVRNGYVYHTLHDSPAMIQPGSIQRAGENILAVVRHLVQSPESLLPDPSVYRHGDAAYFDLFGLVLVVIPLRILLIINYLAIVLVFLKIFRRIRNPKKTGYNFKEYCRTIFGAIVVAILGFFSCILGLSAVATILTVTGHSLSWYSTPPLAFLLYVPVGLCGYVFVHFYPTNIIIGRKFNDVANLDSVFTDALHLIWCCFIFGLRNVGSSYLFTVPMVFTMAFDEIQANLEKIKTWWIGPFHSLFFILWCSPIALSVYNMLLVGSLLTGLAARAGSDTPPELFMVILFGVSMFFCFSTEVSSVLMVKSAKWFYVTMLGFTCLALCISFSSLGFPYRDDPTSPAVKRFYMQHVQRQFFDKRGVLESEDSGMFICHLDYLIKDHHLGPDVVMEADFHKCEGIYCEMPFLLPIQKMVRSTQYITVPPPPASATTGLYPLDITWTGETSTSDNKGQELKISISVEGPPDMAVHIAPLLKGSLVGWSFESDIKHAHSKFSEEEAYFILYGGGIDHPVWNFWLEFFIPGGRTEEPIVELALTAHYQPSGPVSKVNLQTKELKNITSQLHDWVAPMTWTSLYRNYKI